MQSGSEGRRRRLTSEWLNCTQKRAGAKMAAVVVRRQTPVVRRPLSAPVLLVFAFALAFAILSVCVFDSAFAFVIVSILAIAFFIMLTCISCE